MKKLIASLLYLSFTFSTQATDYYVTCKPWKDNPQNFSLEAEIEITGGSYVDAWVSLNVFKNGEEIRTTSNTFSFGVFFIDRLDDQRVFLFELRPAGGGVYKYDYLNLAADHPRPTGNSYLTYKGEQFQAECVTKKR